MNAKLALILLGLAACGTADTSNQRLGIASFPVTCGDLCGHTNVHSQAVTPFTSFQKEVIQAYPFFASAGTASVSVVVNGNSGDPFADDGNGHGNCATVSINGQTPCLSDVRGTGPDGCFTHCTATITTIDDENSLSLVFHLDQGESGWSVMAGTATITLQ